MTGHVRTVLGDIRAEELRRVDYHEHMFQVTPLLPGDELDDEAASTREATMLARSGFDAFVDATPYGLGRQPAALARIAETTGLAIVMTTGLHHRGHYNSSDAVLTADVADLTERFVADLTEGTRVGDRWHEPAEAARTSSGAPVRAGIVKIGIGYWQIDDFSERALRAAAVACRMTGAPTMVHLEYGSAAHEVLDRFATEGLPATRVILAHVDRNPDPGLHRELAARGAYLGYDGPSRHKSWPDDVILRCLAAVAAEPPAASRLLLGGDVARRTRYAAYGGMPGLAYLGERFVPRLRTELDDDVVTQILVTNPARVLQWVSPEG